MPSCTGNGGSGERIVAGDHRDADSGLLARLDGAAGLFPRRINHPHKPQEDQTACEVGRGNFAQFNRVRRDGNGQHPLCLACHVLRLPQEQRSVWPHPEAARPAES